MPKPPRPAHHAPQKRISRHDQLGGALSKTQPLSDSGREQKDLLHHFIRALAREAARRDHSATDE